MINNVSIFDFKNFFKPFSLPIDYLSSIHHNESDNVTWNVALDRVVQRRFPIHASRAPVLDVPTKPLTVGL
jgi:hypothetical protein